MIDAGLFPADRAAGGWRQDSGCASCGKQFGLLRFVSAEFHQDAVNGCIRHILRTPILADTVRRLIVSATANLGPLLQRLSNMEVVGYARYPPDEASGLSALRAAAASSRGAIAARELAAYGAAGMVAVCPRPMTERWSPSENLTLAATAASGIEGAADDVPIASLGAIGAVLRGAKWSGDGQCGGPFRRGYKAHRLGHRVLVIGRHEQAVVADMQARYLFAAHAGGISEGPEAQLVTPSEHRGQGFDQAIGKPFAVRCAE